MTTTTIDCATTRDAHLQAFGRLAPGLPGRGIDWLDRLRRDAFRRFKDAGMPHRGLEAWKFTGLDLLAKHAFSPVPEAAAEAEAEAGSDFGPGGCAAKLVFVDGRFHAGRSRRSTLAKGVTVTTLAAALGQTPGLIAGRLSAVDGAAGALWDLNAAFMAAGAGVRWWGGARATPPGRAEQSRCTVWTWKSTRKRGRWISFDTPPFRTLEKQFIPAMSKGKCRAAPCKESVGL